MDTAVEIIRQLPGYSLDSSTGTDQWHRSANFRRRVSNDTFRYVQEVLRSLGDVTFEMENASHLGAHMLDTDVRIAALEQELERLTSIMTASTTLEVLIAVNDRISIVSRNRDSLIGQRNVLQVESLGPVINISLHQRLPGAPPSDPPSFGQRIANGFSSSLRNSIRAAENFLVGFVRLALPAFVLIVIFVIGGLVVWWLFGRKLQGIFKDTKKASVFTKPDEVKEMEGDIE